MTYKQRLKKAREALDAGKRTEASRHIATALKKKDLSFTELADELGTTKGWVRDFLGQHRHTTAEPFKEPKKRKPARKKPTAKKPVAKVKAAVKKATQRKSSAKKPVSKRASRASSRPKSGSKKS